MPQFLESVRITVYFWANEGMPIEPVHVHVSMETPQSNATRIWITSAGKSYLCNNSSNIPPKTLRNIMRMIEARSAAIIAQWNDYFGEVRFYI